MLGCYETITIVHHNRTDEDTYTNTVYNNASWFEKTTIATDANGAKPSNTYEVRVFEDVTASLGDYVVKGTVDTITKPSDLKSYDYFRITALGDNMRGKLPHWRLSGQ